MSTVHDLKSWPEYFEPVVSGVKPFELREDDRHYHVGDILKLREFEPNSGKYTGREITKLVTYKLEGVGPGAIPPLLGLSRKYCILGLADPAA